MEKLKKAILSYCEFTFEELEYFSKYFFKKSVKKDHLLHKKGHISDTLFFIDSGILSVYIENEDQEIDCAFAFEGTFYCELFGFFRNRPSPYGIKAIKDSDLYCIKKKDLHNLYEINAKYERFSRYLWEEAMIEMSKTLVLHQTENAAHRYLKEMENNYRLLDVPQKNISKYIGITPSSLSRILNSPLKSLNKDERKREG